MLHVIIVGETYLDGSGDPFKVVGFCKQSFGPSKGTEMVVHQNTTSTKENPEPFSALVMTKVQFMKSFNEVLSND